MTLEDAIFAKEFKFTSSDGKERVCRRNGKTKLWKKSPGKFRIPVKYGLYNYWYITEENAHQYRVSRETMMVRPKPDCPNCGAEWTEDGPLCPKCKSNWM